MKYHMSPSTKNTNKFDLFKQRLVRRTISGSDSPASRQLNTEADLTKYSSHKGISKLPSVKDEPTQ